MVTIRIGISERDLRSARESWINQQINRRREDGQSVCVQVIIREGSINMMLSTPSCPGSGGGDWRPNAQEREIINLWKKLGLDKDDFHGGNLVAFLKQLRL
ncbi:MAG: hypothetical protein JRJ42_10595 [Deltaproteobacteria bacterium]|nr:hypothetical protein [Deltaproteobacteria bacterium]